MSVSEHIKLCNSLNRWSIINEKLANDKILSVRALRRDSIINTLTTYYDADNVFNDVVNYVRNSRPTISIQLLFRNDGR